ncbi:hypothetical protein K1T71_003800 [Dendrolimus kikuchii]|uniref:Uncharacterized protein n=1 Tax=Dendrolimus kikuchii TaxID=765133 RepID=A0ACC1D981_9NEOP|nr:hypothetical protein K1T71_003800 [Dendrolimus kikuchii]
MEWSKDKTLKLIELLQMNASLWNPSLCDTRREKQKRKEELRAISDILGISILDATKKIQHLRTQYNRESVREARANAEDPNDRYVSNWYGYEYLHFLKDSNKPYKMLQSVDTTEVLGMPSHLDNTISECKIDSLSPPHKMPRIDSNQSAKPEVPYTTLSRNRDEFTVFGEYIANELRSLKGEKNLLVAKKKIQDVIFEVKMGMIREPRCEASPVLLTHAVPHNTSSLNGGKVYTSPVMSTMSHIDSLSASHSPPRTISEIIINSACHYSNFKVDPQ